MVFCNSVTYSEKKQLEYSHNPYFNRWFSAIWDYGDLSFIAEDVTILILIDGFLQQDYRAEIMHNAECHNPYFNRWFSAILNSSKYVICNGKSQSLF